MLQPLLPRTAALHLTGSPAAVWRTRLGSRGNGARFRNLVGGALSAGNKSAKK